MSLLPTFAGLNAIAYAAAYTALKPDFAWRLLFWLGLFTREPSAVYKGVCVPIETLPKMRAGKKPRRQHSAALKARARWLDYAVVIDCV